MSTVITSGIDYVPREPIKQFKGTDPETGLRTFYKIDADGVIIAKSIPATLNSWITLQQNQEPFLRPSDLEIAVTKNDLDQVMSDLNSSGYFKARTEYIKIGDEPKGARVVDITAQLSEDETSDLKELLKLMPRAILYDWFKKEIVPGLPGTASILDPSMDEYGRDLKKPMESMMWAGFIDLFNEANLEYVNDQQMAPWDWEAEKMRSYYLAQSEEATQTIKADFDKFASETYINNPEAARILKDFQRLPKLGDPGLEISRQIALNELLKAREFESAQTIVNAYRIANDTVLGEALKGPVPFQVTVGEYTVKPTMISDT